MTAAEPARKSDLPIRAVAGVVMIAVALAAIYFGGWPFRLLVGLGAALMFAEWCDMHRLRRPWPLVGIALLAANLWIIPEFFFASAQFEGRPAPDVWYGLAATAGIGLLLGLVARNARLGWGYVYIAVPSFALLILNWISWQAVLWAMIVTWSTDIFAYFAGRSIGGPKLAPRISPNKTWAGLIGGMAGGEVLGAVTAQAFGLGLTFMAIGGLMGLLAQLGDLYESSVKRKAGVKDSGRILPGHGGVLDRLDGLLPVALATLAVAGVVSWAA
ncbi:MAG TPA: phosphatidate cytidylyltransferase [Allosphingosinicella sp.]|uniref:phosphatidate cytidylyltransferase n=1 Tax=Allosphingosinicella sp. TaxID=2823234 RepID=UPI002ED89748